MCYETHSWHHCWPENLWLVTLNFRGQRRCTSKQSWSRCGLFYHWPIIFWAWVLSCKVFSGKTLEPCEISFWETHSHTGWCPFLLPVWNSHFFGVYCSDSLILRLRDTGIAFKCHRISQAGYQATLWVPQGQRRGVLSIQQLSKTWLVQNKL